MVKVVCVVRRLIALCYRVEAERLLFHPATFQPKILYFHRARLLKPCYLLLAKHAGLGNSRTSVALIINAARGQQLPQGNYLALLQQLLSLLHLN